MQALHILRGCLCAYFAGVVVISLGSILFDGSDPSILGVTAVFGLIFAVPFIIVAFVIWITFASQNTIIKAWHAVTICAVVFGSAVALVAYGGNPIYLTIIVIPVAGAVGAAFGVAFWIGAFGLQREVLMSRNRKDN